MSKIASGVNMNGGSAIAIMNASVNVIANGMIDNIEFCASSMLDFMGA